MGRRRVVLVSLIILVIAAAWLTIPALQARFLSSPFTAVRVASISFYSRMRSQRCLPTSRASTSFPASSAGLYELVAFTKWSGRHTLTTEWYSPGDVFYDSISVQNSNITQLCGYLPVYGDEASSRTGKWTLQVTADGHVLRSKSFWIWSVGPPLARVIPQRLCRFGCTATFGSPSGGTIHMTFSGHTGLVRFLRRHPGIRIELIVGKHA
ncbi:MAG: hypothetical protein PVSMB7_07680 [Chloroflexota bacterium]